MKITLLTDDYLPESTRNHARMIHELAVEFLKRGHEVTVITPSDGAQKQRLIEDYLDGVQVFRFKSSPIRGVGKFFRAVNETLLSLRALLAVRTRISSMKPDLCVVYSPTIFFGPFAWFLRRKGAYIYLVLRDFFPQWVIDEGMIKEGSIIARYFRAFERLNYRVSDCIALQSPANLPVFNAMFAQHPNVTVLMNWADAKPTVNEIGGSGFRDSLGLQKKVVFFYGGNIGHAQDMQNILRLARSMLTHANAHFLLIGQGDEFELVKETKVTWNLNNLTLLPSVSQTEYSRLLCEVDIGLFSLSKHHRAHNFPGKLLGYMRQSLPILGSVNVGNDVVDVVNESEAGLVTINGDDETLHKNAEALLFDQTLRAKLGAGSRRLLLSTFSVESAASKILEKKMEVVN